MKMKLNLKTKAQISEKKIIIDCFDKILVSYCDGVSLVCCEECIRSRFINTRKDRANLRNANTTGLKCDKIFDSLVNSLISLLREDKRLLDEFNRRKVFIIDKNTLSISWEYVMPVSDCSVCGCMLIDSLNIAQILGQSILDDVYGNESIPFRSKNYKEVAKRVEKFALSKNFGIITTLLDNFDGPFPISVAMLPLENGKDEPGTGRTSSGYHDASDADKNPRNNHHRSSGKGRINGTRAIIKNGFSVMKYGTEQAVLFCSAVGEISDDIFPASSCIPSFSGAMMCSRSGN